MTCQQARNILAAVTVHNDRLEALQYVKRLVIKFMIFIRRKILVLEHSMMHIHRKEQIIF